MRVRFSPLRLLALALSCCVGVNCLCQRELSAAPNTVGMPGAAIKPTSTPSKPSASAAAHADPKAQQVLKSMCDHYRGVKSITVKLGANMTILNGKDRQELPAEYKISIERPNKYSIELISSRGGTVVSNGKRAEFYFAPPKSYMIDKAPATLDEAFEKREFNFVTAGLLAFSLIKELMEKDPLAAVMNGVSNAQYIGLEKINGAEYHHIKMFHKDFNRDVWVKNGTPPTLYKVEPDMSGALNAQARRAGSKILLAMVYKDQDFNKSMNDGRFEISHPPGAKYVRAFFHEDGEELIGKKAPEVTLPLIDGTNVKLSSLLGRFVILDFWATWCGPCVMSMPVFAKASEQFKSKNVVFIAVNKGEQASAIKHFFKLNALHVPAALDANEKIAAAYNVQGIPCTVFIGKDGIVKGVHVGVNPNNIKEHFIADVEKFMAGKSLKRQQ